MVQTQSLTPMNILDFDGCLGSPIEEALFTLPKTSEDGGFVAKMSERHEMNLSGEHYYSARYIAMQAALFDLEIPCQPGPIIDLIKEGQYYVLTARSDRFAVERMREFLEQQVRLPIKIMQVDTLPKGKILETLLERYPDYHFTFYDDNLKHISSAKFLRHPRLDVKHVDNDMEPFYIEASSLYRRILDHAL